MLSIVLHKPLKMIINHVIFKRDAFLNARIPKEVKDQFEILAKAKGRTMSEFILEIILKEFEREGVQIQATASNPKTEDHA